MKLRLKMGQIWYVWGAFCLAKEGILGRNLELFLNVFLFCCEILIKNLHVIIKNQIFKRAKSQIMINLKSLNWRF